MVGGSGQLLEIIDLTNDSEDDYSGLRATGLQIFFPASNRGLPDPDEFKSNEPELPSTGILQKNYIPSGKTAADKSKQSSIKPSSNTTINSTLRVAQYPPILPGSTIHSWQASRTHNNGKSSVAGSPGAMYTSNVSRLQSTGGAVHEPNNHLVKEDEDISFTYSPLMPRAQPSDLKRQKTNGGFQSRVRVEPPPILPAPKTVITGASHLLHPTPVERTLKTQVVPHTQKAIERHRTKSTLSMAQFEEIGSLVLNNITRAPGFAQHLAESKNTLSSEYEQALARRAQHDVDLAVERYSSRSIISSEDAHETPTSADSPASTAIFENPNELPKGPSLRRSCARDTSSPATSLSSSREASQQLPEHDNVHVPRAALRKSNPRRAAQGKDYRLGVNPGNSFSRKQTPTNYSLEYSSHRPSDDDEFSARKKVNERETRFNKPRTADASQKEKQSAKSWRVAVEVPFKRPGEHLLTSENDSKTNDETATTKRSHDVITASSTLAALPSRATQSPPLSAQVEAMIRVRGIHGMAPLGLRGVKLSYQTVGTNALEDALTRVREWFPQSSDSVTITWVGPSMFVSGALTHYDVHNMQYNRHGNLVVGSTLSNTVKMIDGHRTLRPIVTSEENMENSLPAMRATQSRWRYAPVVSSAYCELNDYTFTASYDKTVKIWKVSQSGPSMELQGIWEHDAFVNFVVTSKHHERIATASAAQNDAVRVYTFDEMDLSQSAYDVYNAERAMNRPSDPRMVDSWAYHPATLQWGRAERVSDLLLVGYSPRGVGGDEAIPVARKNTGELCCWNTATGEQVPISASRSQNVFEVIWHPSQPMFLVAASPAGTYDTKRTKTQVRLFQLQGLAGVESFQCVKTLDCPALDINELTIMPTSIFGGYVTASCTDGRTYVWDTMHEDRVLHVLAHGESIDNPDPGIPLELADSGVKFAAWGQSRNRFYTGSSDGVVKVWDITRAGSPFLRDVFQAQGGIACGVFSNDHMELLVGDASGHVHLIRAPDEDDSDDDPAEPSARRAMPTWKKMMVPHADPDAVPDESDDPIDSINAMQIDENEAIRNYMEEGVLREFPIDLPGSWAHRKKVGQGPNYAELGLYRNEFHIGGDPNMPLMVKVMPENQEFHSALKEALSREETFPVLPRVKSNMKRRQRDEDLDLDIEKLLISDSSEELRRDLEISGELLYDIED